MKLSLKSILIVFVACFALVTSDIVLKLHNSKYEYPVTSNKWLFMKYNSVNKYLEISYGKEAHKIPLEEIIAHLKSCNFKEDADNQIYGIDFAYKSKPCYADFRLIPHEPFIKELPFSLCCRQTQKVHFVVLNENVDEDIEYKLKTEDGAIVEFEDPRLSFFSYPFTVYDSIGVQLLLQIKKDDKTKNSNKIEVKDEDENEFTQGDYQQVGLQTKKSRATDSAEGGENIKKEIQIIMPKEAEDAGEKSYDEAREETSEGAIERINNKTGRKTWERTKETKIKQKPQSSEKTQKKQTIKNNKKERLETQGNLRETRETKKNFLKGNQSDTKESKGNETSIITKKNKNKATRKKKTITSEAIEAELQETENSKNEPSEAIKIELKNSKGKENDTKPKMKNEWVGSYCPNGYITKYGLPHLDDNTLASKNLRPCYKMRGRLLGLSVYECKLFQGIYFYNYGKNRYECYIDMNNAPHILNTCGGLVDGFHLIYNVDVTGLSCGEKYKFKLILTKEEKDFWLEFFNANYGFTIKEDPFFITNYVPSSSLATKVLTAEGGHYFVKEVGCDKHMDFYYNDKILKERITMIFRERDVRKLKLDKDKVLSICNLFGQAYISQEMPKYICAFSSIDAHYLSKDREITYSNIGISLNTGKNDKTISERGLLELKINNEIRENFNYELRTIHYLFLENS
jgi:hypothetical protein